MWFDCWYLFLRIPPHFLPDSAKESQIIVPSSYHLFITFSRKKRLKEA